MRLVIAHLYPELLGVYGDRGNVLALARRAAWRGLEVRVIPVGVGEACDLDAVDVVCIGGGEDRQQAAVAADLGQRAQALRAAVDGGMPLLAICGGYQLLGHWYQPAAGERLTGVGIFDATTGPGPGRLVGNVVVEGTVAGTLVGFENHGGRTVLGATARPLGRVRPGRGGGNNGRDGTEGALRGRAVGTYLHGALLPKNPALADFLLEGALVRRYGAQARAVLTPLDDALEAAAARTARALPYRGRP